MNIESVLTAEQLPGFSTFQVTGDVVTNDGELQVAEMPDGRTTIKLPFQAAKGIQAARLSDGAQLKVDVAVYLNKELAAKCFRKEPIRAFVIPVEQVSGTRSGKKIGDESYHKKVGRIGRIRKSAFIGKQGTKAPRVTAVPLRKPTLSQSNYGLFTRAGRAVVIVDLTLVEQRDDQGNVIHNEDGEPKRGQLSQEDIAFVEDLATTTLNKLEKLGYTKDP